MARIVLPRSLSYSADSVTAVQGAAGSEPWLTAEQNTLVPRQFDHLSLTYDPVIADRVSQVRYRQGGAAGSLVATLTLTYNGSGNIASVTRT